MTTAEIIANPFEVLDDAQGDAGDNSEVLKEEILARPRSPASPPVRQSRPPFAQPRLARLSSRVEKGKD